jgi:cell volume regulation protein A
MIAVVTREVILTLSVLLAAGLASRLLAEVLRVPEVLVLVGLGIAIGPHALNVVDVPLDSLGAQLIFTLGVSTILFYGGLNLSLRVLRGVAMSLGALVVPGVVITALITGTAAHLAFGLQWTESILLGAVLAPTDPAILIPLFLGGRLARKLSQTVIAESAFNDPTGAVLALAVAGVLLTGDDSVAAPAIDFVTEVGVSAVIGILAGVILSAAISSRRAGIWRESSAIAVLTVVSIAYVSLDSAGGSGYLGAFLAGLIVGNMDLLRLDMHPEHERDMHVFTSSLADVVTLFVFLVLGASLPLGALSEHLLPALAVLAVLMLVARPVTVLVCALPDRRAAWTRRELAFLCWTRETGVVPAALVGFLGALGVPDLDVLTSVVALAIVATLLLQALPAEWLAGRLGLLDPPPVTDELPTRAAGRA